MVDKLVYSFTDLAHVKPVAIAETSQLELLDAVLDGTDLALLQRELLLQLELEASQFGQHLQAVRAQSAVEPGGRASVLSNTAYFFVVRDEQLDLSEALIDLSHPDFVALALELLGALQFLDLGGELLDGLL